MTDKIRTAILLLLLAICPVDAAVTLKPETKAAWDAYLREATAAMQARLQPGAHFLWLDEEPGRPEHVRTQGPTSVQPPARFPEKFHPD